MQIKKSRSMFIILFIIILIVTGLTACGTESSLTPSDKNSENLSATGDQYNKDALGAYELTIAGGSPGGFFSVMTEGYANIVRSAMPDTQISVEPGDIATGIMKLMNGEVEVAWAQITEASAAYSGKEPFPEPLEVRVMFTAWVDNPFQFIIEKSFAERYGIESLADIARTKPPIRMGVNVKGILTEALFSDIITELGFTYEDVQNWGGSIFHTNAKGATEEMQNGKLDFFAMPVFAPSSDILTLAQQRELKIIGIGDENVMNKVAEDWKLDKTILKQGTYDFVDKDVETYAISGMALVRHDASEDMVYDLTKTFFENLEAYRGLHQALNGLTEDKAANSSIPFHPGAEKYLKEVGLIE